MKKNITKESAIRYLQDTSDSISSLIKFIIARVRDFSIFDFALMKLCLISFGLYLGSKFAAFFKKFRIVLFMWFIFSSLYMIWRIFISED